MPSSDIERAVSAEERELIQLRSLETAVRILVDKKLSRRARDSAGGALAFRKKQWGRVHNAIRRLDKIRAAAALARTETRES